MTALGSLLKFTITLQAPTGAPDKWGSYTYAAGTDHPAFIAFKKRRVIGFDGREAFSNAQIFLEGDVTVESTYKITLPAGMTPQTLLLEAGAPLQHVQKWLGHGTIQLTADTYGYGRGTAGAEGALEAMDVDSGVASDPRKLVTRHGLEP